MPRVTENVYVETEFLGCNPGFIKTDDGVILVDTPMKPSEAVKWRDQVSKFGQILYIINTEHHPDHIIGNFFFPGVIISQQGTRDKFNAVIGDKDKILDKLQGLGLELTEYDMQLIRDYAPNPPDITFKDELKIYAGNQTLHIIRLPGHTENETVVVVPKERVAFVSDNLFNNRMPWLHESVPFEWLEALQRIKELDVDILIPGHGNVCDKKPLDTMEKFLKEVIDEVQQAIDNGLRRDAAAAKITFIDRFPIPKFQQRRAPMVQRMNVSRIYDVLSESRSKR